MELLVTGVMGSAFQVVLASNTSMVGDFTDSHINAAVVSTGFGGGVLGGALLPFLYTPKTMLAWPVAAVAGVLVFDYFLFKF